MRRRAAVPLLVLLALLACPAAFAAEAAGEHEGMTREQIAWELGIKVLDVAIIAFLGFKFLSKPVAAAMAARADGVRRSLEEATAGRREAEARLREFQARTAGLEGEIAALREKAGIDIERERALLLQEAKSAADRVGEHARETLRQEVAKARAELHREAADLAVRVATETVRARVSGDDQRRLAGDYLKEMEAAR